MPSELAKSTKSTGNAYMYSTFDIGTMSSIKNRLCVRCTRHATRGSLEVTMLGGMGGQTLG